LGPGQVEDPLARLERNRVEQRGQLVEAHALDGRRDADQRLARPVTARERPQAEPDAGPVEA
jgi:hypothetical protein